VLSSAPAWKGRVAAAQASTTWRLDRRHISASAPLLVHNCDHISLCTLLVDNCDHTSLCTLLVNDCDHISLCTLLVDNCDHTSLCTLLVDNCDHTSLCTLLSTTVTTPVHVGGNWTMQNKTYCRILTAGTDKCLLLVTCVYVPLDSLARCLLLQFPCACLALPTAAPAPTSPPSTACPENSFSGGSSSGAPWHGARASTPGDPNHDGMHLQIAWQISDFLGSHRTFQLKDVLRRPTFYIW